MALNIADPYDRPARLYPALLVFAAPVCSLEVLAPNQWLLLKGLSAALTACGFWFLLPQWTRAAGRKLQADMERRDGRRSTVALRHRDDHINQFTKARFHALLRARGLTIPTPQAEAADPALADAYYASACDQLRELTRDTKKYPLLFKENVTYGFRRNLVAMKPVAITILIGTVLGDAATLWALGPADAARFWAGLVLEAVNCGLLAAWLFVFTRKFVDDASWSYTDRLLAALEHLPAPAQKAKAKKAT